MSKSNQENKETELYKFMEALSKDSDIPLSDILKMVDEKLDEITEVMEDLQAISEAEEEMRKVPETIDISVNDINTKLNNNLDYYKEQLEGVDTILCITRGGMVFASILAYKLGIKNIININVSSYTDENKQEELRIGKLSKKDIKRLNNANRFVLIDDIIDSGNTIIAVTNYLDDTVTPEALKNATSFVVVNKWEIYNEHLSLFDYVGDDRWVIFEWDK